jgi:acetyltransferase-like isoleucine patch superfamily enzyme
VVIEDHVYIGSGAVLKQGIRIGSNATIGMGAIVISDVEANTVVAGNPARIIRKNEK